MEKGRLYLFTIAGDPSFPADPIAQQFLSSITIFPGPIDPPSAATGDKGAAPYVSTEGRYSVVMPGKIYELKAGPKGGQGDMTAMIAGANYETGTLLVASAPTCRRKSHPGSMQTRGSTA